MFAISFPSIANLADFEKLFRAAQAAMFSDKQGGVFRWVGEAYGARTGFLAIWLQWIESTIWYPTVLTFGAVSIAFIGMNETYDMSLASNKVFTLIVVLAIYWVATLVSLKGMDWVGKISKWGGMIGTIIPAGLLILLGIIYISTGGHNYMDMSQGFFPDLTNFDNLVLASSIFLFYAGMEMMGIHVMDVKNPSRNYPKAIVIGYPNNPTGTVMSAEELMPIAKFAEEHDLIVLSDEIYCELMYGDAKFTSFAKLPGMRERTVIFNGFSKAYAMTGMRLGYVCAPREGLAPILKLHQYAIMCANTTAQVGGITALKECDDDVEAMRQEYDRRRKVIYKGLCDMGLPVFEPKGAFYIFPDIRCTGMTSAEFCEKLVQEEKVAVVPGTAFGDQGEGFVRISYAASMDTIQEALKRMACFVAKYRKD